MLINIYKRYFKQADKLIDVALQTAVLSQQSK